MSSGHCYIWKHMFLSETKSGIWEHHLSLRPPLLFLSFFPPEWYRVFCLSAQVNGKVEAEFNQCSELPDEGRWSGPLLWLTHLGSGYKSQTKCVSSQPWKAMFSRVEQVFLITDLSGCGKAESIKHEPRKKLNIKRIKILPEHYINFITAWLFQGYFSIIMLN